MEELTDGCSVRIQGLVSTTQHNGKKGVLICFDERTGRWGVEVGDAELLAVKPASLVFVREPVEIDDSERQRPADIPTSDCPRATREQHGEAACCSSLPPCSPASTGVCFQAQTSRSHAHGRNRLFYRKGNKPVSVLYLKLCNVDVVKSKREVGVSVNRRIMCKMPYIKEDVPVVFVFRALGFCEDKEILQMVRPFVSPLSLLLLLSFNCFFAADLLQSSRPADARSHAGHHSARQRKRQY